jgi:multidrug resistance efflux pump
VLDAAGGLLRRLFGPRHAAFKLSALALAATVAFFAIATGEHRVSANAELEGAVRRVIVAPFDGFVLTAGARAGEEVAAGAVLALLDDRELRLDAQRWSSQAEQFTGQANAAEAQGDLGQLRIAQAQIRQAEAQRNLALSQIERARIVAPFDGLVVSGDLSQQLGAGVRKGQVLFEVAPLDRYRIVLKVDERDMSWVSAGQRGDLVLAALSDLRLPFTVTLVTPVANATGGKNVFRVEATLDEAPAQLRPGMEGIGKIAIGERLLIWVWTHRFFDWLRLQAWIWLGV